MLCAADMKLEKVVRLDMMNRGLLVRGAVGNNMSPGGAGSDV